MKKGKKKRAYGFVSFHKLKTLRTLQFQRNADNVCYTEGKKKVINMTCSLPKCNPVCSALTAAIYVCPFVKSINARNTCSGAKLSSSPAPRCCCIKLGLFGVFLIGYPLHCTLQPLLVLIFSASNHTVCMSMCIVLRSVAASFVCNVQHMGSCNTVLANVHHRQVLQISFSFWNLF